MQQEANLLWCYAITFNIKTECRERNRNDTQEEKWKREKNIRNSELYASLGRDQS